MGCVGVEACGKKNCLEQERCVSYPATLRLKGPKPKKRKINSDIKVNLCQQNIKFCSNARVCEILGQCMLDHPSVKANKQFTRELRKAKDFKAIVGIFERFMPKSKWKTNKRK